MALVELVTAVADADAFADALLEAGAVAVSIEDADAASDAEQPLYGEPALAAAMAEWPNSRLRIIVEAGNADAVVAAASVRCEIPCPPIASVAAVRDTDWVSASQAQFEPTRIGERLWIGPTWHQAPADTLVVRIDPGTAFGTGAHPTTRLCLRWLERELVAGQSVLDYGCGSGILTIAAAKLGAGRAVGVDIDPIALAAARVNSAANHIAASYTDPDSLGQQTFDIVVANILANPLQLLAPALLMRVAPAGALVLSGVLERQAQGVIDVYCRHAHAIALGIDAVDEGWVCLAGRRVAGPEITPNGGER